jgi:tRNA (guanine-N7-)-methyltransferase
VLEIGFGNGEQLLASALAEPDRDFLGIEVHRPGVGYLLARAAAAGVTNLRVINHDAVAVLTNLLAPGSLAEVRVLFPDPWPKKRQQKRRLIQPPFLALLATRLAPGGVLHLATDWEDYAQQMLAVGDAAPDYANAHGAGHYAPRPDWRVESRFERRGTRLGHGVWDLTFRRT